LGAIGDVKFRKGVGTLSNDMVGLFTDSVNGLLTATDKAMQDQIDSLGESITRLNTRLTDKQQELKQRFARMEEAISKVQAQGNQLASLAVRASSS
jgi:flagellar capping protein FliD